MPGLRLRTALAAASVGTMLVLSATLSAGASPSHEPAAAAVCPLVIKNGSFEAQAANWTQSGAGSMQLITNLNPRAGSYSADLGGVNSTDHSIKQTVSLQNQRNLTLTFWWEQWTQETAPGDFADYLTVDLLKGDGSLLKQLAKLGVDPDRPPWELLTYDLSAYAGQTVQLRFTAHNDNTNPTEFFVDDVSVPACRTYFPFNRK
jgi:hypothetical protein